MCLGTIKAVAGLPPEPGLQVPQVNTSPQNQSKEEVSLVLTVTLRAQTICKE